LPARILDDIVGRIADLQHRIAVIVGVLVAGNPDHYGVKALDHLVVGAQIQGRIAAAAPGRVTAPGAVEGIVYAPLAVGTDEIVGLDLAVQIEAVADAAVTCG
jgi:hypothetical protein